MALQAERNPGGQLGRSYSDECKHIKHDKCIEILGKLHLHCSRNSEVKQQSLDQEENDFYI
jgi:hypothetical protein